MYGFNHLPPIQNAISVTEFIGQNNQSSNTTGFYSYTIPAGATFLYVVLIGKGGEGGKPTVGAASSGGGGGGSGAVTKAMLPVFLLPKVLYISLSSRNYSASSVVSVTNELNSVGVLLYASSGATPSTGAGAAGSAMGTSSARWAGTLALWVSEGGAAGGAGSTTNGAAVTALATLPLTGGGGGGGSSAGTGGNITGAGPFPTISGGASGLNPGNGGMMLRQPFGGVGGSGGGGSSGAGTGANNGGDGAIGCGGGGGGNAASGTPGAGGRGGPGYCLIVAF